MIGKFSYDVFLSHSAKDKAVVRPLAEQLRKDGLKVWFSEWEIKPDEKQISWRIESGLNASRVLVLCLSGNASGSDWAELESQTFGFRDPLNKERRFIPLRLDDSPLKPSLAQFLHIAWNLPDHEHEYAKLLEACRAEKEPEARDSLLQRILAVGHVQPVRSVAFSSDGAFALSGALDGTMRLWEVKTGCCLRVLDGHTDSVLSVAWSPDRTRALSGARNKAVVVWEVESGRCLHAMEGHTDSVWSVAWSPDGRHVSSGAGDKTVRLWDVESGRTLRVLEGHGDSVWSVAWSPDGARLLSGSIDNTLRLWQADSGRCVHVLKGHTDRVWSVAWSPDGAHALSGSFDRTMRLWEVESGRCLRVMKRHTDSVLSVAWSPDGRHIISGEADNVLRLWEAKSGRCLRMMKGHSGSVWSIAWSPNGRHALSGAGDNTLRVWEVDSGKCLRVMEADTDRVSSLAWSPDGRRALSAVAGGETLRLWEVESGRCLRVMKGHTASIVSVAWSPDGQRAFSAAGDNTLRLWEVDSGKCLRVMEGDTGSVLGLACSPDGQRVLSGASEDKTMRLWDVQSGRCLRVLEGHTGVIARAVWSPDGRRALSAAEDHTVRLWEVESGRCMSLLEGHYGGVVSVAWSPDGLRALSGAADKTMRLWEVESGRCVRVLEGHTATVRSVAWNSDGRHALSGGEDKTVRLWDVELGRCLGVLARHTIGIRSVAWSADQRRALLLDALGRIHQCELSEFVGKGPTLHVPTRASEQIQYTNAKILLVGESGVGKTGLSNYLAHKKRVEEDKPLPSTDGAWATHWPLQDDKKKPGMEREIWLWDFAGQVDYRLVHQLFMDDTAAAVLVFNPQNENPFEGLGHWDRDLQKATRKPFAKLLAAARVDRGGLVVSAASMKKFMKERGFLGPLHLTSAKTGEGCDQLREAILEIIDWKGIPETTSPALYHRLKQEILSLRDSGLVLIRLAELKQRMEMTLRGENFELAELEAVLGLLAGPGMILRLDFGGFILLRPEVLSRYAAAVVRKVRKHPQELGCIREDEMLAGDLDYQDFKRLERQDEAVVLRTLLETFISRAWCLRQPCDGSAMLTFPSYFRRERKEQPSHPSVLVTYRFDGTADDIYATLVVRLHHTLAFDVVDLWKSAADFKTQLGSKLGFTLLRDEEGTSRLEVYFEPDVDGNSRLLFLRYVHDHLTQHAKNVVRLRRYYCGEKKCDGAKEPFSDQAKIDKALGPGGRGKVFCPDCGEPIHLRDVIEEKFTSVGIQIEARMLEAQAKTAIDNESRELILVGHTFAIVGEAGQIYRGYTNSDHGIDGEIEFKDDEGCASGKRLYVQLKSGDSYLKKRRRDGTEVFRIKNPRWADYWQEQAYAVMLIIRTSDGEIRWMDVSTYLKRESVGGKKVRQIVFTGEPFDLMSVRRWRERACGVVGRLG